MEVITITARTLGGSEYPIQTDNGTTIDQLKQLVAFHSKGELKEQDIRFVKGLKSLTEGSKTLKDLNIKDGDTVHIVRSLQGSQENDDDSPAGSEIKSANKNVVTVTVPSGHGPGSKLLIQPPGRSQMMVMVPRGVSAGGTFRVQLPPLNSSSSSSTTPSPSTPSSNAASPQVMQVKCPAGVGPGQQITVSVPGRGRMRVVVPNGVSPGQSFRFQVPAS